MRLLPLLLATLAALVLPACGDKGGSSAGGGGVLGTWVLDTDAVLASALAEAEGEMKKQMEQLPPEQREMMKKMMSEQNVMGKMKEQIKALDGTLTIAADKTFTATMKTGSPEAETLAGGWTQSGAKITLTPTTKNGKPATGADVEKPLTLELRGAVLVSTGDDGGPQFTFKRK